jgi:hypothetical protein
MKKDYAEYINIVKANSREIRNKVLKCLMVRRTRTEIERYFSKDIRYLLEPDQNDAESGAY